MWKLSRLTLEVSTHLDLPTLGNPTIPIFKLLEGLPRRIFFTSSVFFLGGIFRFASVGADVWRGRVRLQKRRGVKSMNRAL